MSDQSSCPSGKDPKQDSNPPPRGRTPFSDSASTQRASPLLNGTMRASNSSSDELERDRRRIPSSWGNQNSYHPHWDRPRSRSPTRSSPPVRARDDNHLLGMGRRALPPLSDISLSPFRGVQSRESSLRSTARASPLGVESLPTPTSRDASEHPPPSNASPSHTSPPTAASPSGLFSRPMSDCPPRNASHTHASPPVGEHMYNPHWREALGYPPDILTHVSPPGGRPLYTPISRDASEQPPPCNASPVPASTPAAASPSGLVSRPVSDCPPRNASHTHASPPGGEYMYNPHWREALGYPPDTLTHASPPAGRSLYTPGGLGYPPDGNASRASPSPPPARRLPPLDFRDISEFPLPRDAPPPPPRRPAAPMPIDFNPFTAPDPTPGGQEEEDHEIVCEFSDPCNMDPSPDGMHFRKVISHIFGRNKASTKLFPNWVWVQYCRKHYQRARYRADQWPFTQCELLLEGLDRMKRWDGVKSFELILRRREVLRLEEEAAEPSQGRAAAAGSAGLLPSGRKHPTAVVAPVPDWLRARRGQEMSFEGLRNLIVEIRDYMVQLRAQEKAREASQGGDAKGKGKAKAKGEAKGKDKKPGEIRKQASCVRFPDVEILPRFKQWVIDKALRDRQASKKQVTKDAGDKKGKGKKAKKGNQAEENCEDTSDTGETSAPTGEAGGASSTVGPSNADQYSNDSTLSDARRRRSERIFLRTIEKNDQATRVSSRGSVKKPSKKKEE